MYTIEKFDREGTCELSGKDGEVVIVSSQQHGLNRAVLAVPELVKLMRFHLAQAAKVEARPQRL